LCLNPLKRVNSILTMRKTYYNKTIEESQSPQTGQFNSYEPNCKQAKDLLDVSQSPQTGQFNSYIKVL